MSRSSLLYCWVILASLPLLAAPAPPTAPSPAVAPPPPAASPSPIPQPPAVEARAYILIDYDSGRVLAELHADDRNEPASLTKVMTSYAVFAALKEGRLKLTDMVPISEHAWRAEGSRTFVQVGTQIPAEVLIKGMLVQSGNDATIALAEKVGGTESAFAQLMNMYAKRVGLKATNFVNSDGLPDPNHYSTARDMATLSRAVIHDYPQFYQWYGIREFTWNNIKQENRNGLLMRDPTVDGIKTGHTDSAGFCLITSAKRGGMRLISVVMGSPSIKAREDASSALLTYGFTFYETGKVKSRGELILKPHVYKGATDTVAAGSPADLWVTVGRGQLANLHSSVNVKQPLIAPIAAGAAIGDFTLTGPTGDVVVRSPLVALAADPPGGIWTRMVDSIQLWFK
ncbi:MAG TPA: D-alanyl-D-alanine carboxypeptidase family protein [Steroidobacteraceae bacterium]